MTLRLVGTCPVCERQQKVTPEHAMVHHGFRRPGVGHIIGDCFGVGWPAYEISSKGCSAYRKTLAEWRASQEAQLVRFYARPETVAYQPSPYSPPKVYRRDADTYEERRRYDSTLVTLIKQAEYTIQDLDRSDRRMVELIERWAPAPLIEIDEEGLTPVKRQERAERKAERDAKRSEKERKRQELEVKRNERLARKATTLLFFFDEFERLAAAPSSKARDDYGRDLIFETNKKKYGLSYPHDLFWGPDDGYGNRMRGPWGRGTVEHAQRTLLKLGLAREEQIHGRPFFELLQVYRPSASGNKIRVPEPDPTRSAEEILDDIARMAPGA